MHYYSYAINSKTNVKQFYNQAHEFDYFHYSSETIVHLKLIKQYTADLFFKTSSFRSFCASYNYLNMPNTKERRELEPKRLADIFYTFELLKYFTEFKNEPLLSILFSRINYS